MEEHFPSLRETGAGTAETSGRKRRETQCEKGRSPSPGQTVHILQRELLQNTSGNIINHETGHVDRISGRRVGRRIGQIQIF